MTSRLAGLGAVALLVGLAAPLRGQILSTDARRVGMGGLSLQREGALARYNPAYRAAPPRGGMAGSPKATIPLPLGLIQVVSDLPTLDPDDPAFNPVEVLDLVLNPPLFLELKAAPTPTNDVEFTIGKNELIVDLGEAQTLIPSDEFGMGGSSRLLDAGIGYKGFHFGVMGWLHNDVAFALGDTLRAFLKDAAPATTNTRYNILGDALAQAGLAPTLSYTGRVWGDSTRGLYLGAAIRYYLGATHGGGAGDFGFTTGDTIFTSNNPLTPDASVLVHYSRPGRALGRGVGGDLGVVWVSGPLELGLGVNDIGAKLTWSDTRVELVTWDTTNNTTRSTLIADHVTRTTRLPVSYVANVALTLNDRATVGADLLDNGRGTILHVGVEQWFGPLAVRGGVARDQRKKMQFGAGVGIRFGSVGLDAGIATHSNSLSDKRGITLATSLSLY